MHAEVDDGDVGRSRPAESDELQRFVGRSERFLDVGVEDAGIGADGTVLHAVATDERNVAADGLGDTDPRRSHIGKREPPGVRQLGDAHVCKKRHEPILLLREARPWPVGGASVSVRRMDVDPVARNARRRRDRRERLCHEGISQVQVVDAVDERAVRAVRDGHAVDIERIQHPVGDAMGEVPDKRDAKRRRDVDAGEAGRKFRENSPRPEGERQYDRRLCFHFHA